jgi:hypothetical protein
MRRFEKDYLAGLVEAVLVVGAIYLLALIAVTATALIDEVLS